MKTLLNLEITRKDLDVLLDMAMAKGRYYKLNNHNKQTIQAFARVYEKLQALQLVDFVLQDVLVTQEEDNDY